MSVERDDIRAAVASGLVSERQAAGLIALSDARRGARGAIRPGEEPFELFRGFNEIFIVVGLTILASGWQGLSLALTGTVLDTGYALWSAGAAGLVWLLSEYFVRRRRMVAPAIALVLFFGAAVAGIAAGLLVRPLDVLTGGVWGDAIPVILTTVGGLALHFARFRVPFTMAPIALGLFLAAVIAIADAGNRAPDFRDLFILGAQGGFAYATLGLGLLFFALAMWFDAGDRFRVGRRSANAFWLHIVAAPAIVNTVAVTLLEDPSGGHLALLAAFLALIAAVAIVIDRRSFLVSGAGYVVILAGLVAKGLGIALAIVSIGVILVALGAFWERFRAGLLRALGPVLPLDRLPPAAGTTERF